ncbi:unnamed protein product [Rotaria sordida]|uniref:Uncharacterized protein n=1 Tax=Rotaria sordida TaxID=392033 RepID=A0A815GU77_9BILA|nr:unnamed protein product [Rotaria sordida]
MTKDLSKQTADLLWFQLYHDILFQLSYDETAKQEMIDASHFYYRDNIKVLEVIEKFENDYRSEEVFQWYLKKSFPYKIINKALRVKDFDQLYIFRYFMKDLTESFIRAHQQLVETSKELSITYREMRLTKDQIKKFKENEGKLVSTNGLLTTNILRSTTLKQALEPTTQTDLVSVLLEIHCNEQYLNSSVIVADNFHSSKSSCDKEQEIIFNSNVTFRVESVRKEEEIWLIKMNASNEGQNIKEKYIKDSHRQIEGLSIEVLFGRLMCDMGLWNQSQYFLEYLLNKSNSNQKDLIIIECSLGEVLQWKGEWNEARKYYDHVYNRIMKAKPKQISNLAFILFNIGELLYLEGKYDEASDYYEQALTVRKENCLFTMIDESCPANYERSSIISYIRRFFRPVVLNFGELVQIYFRWFWNRWFKGLFGRFLSKYMTNKRELVGKKLTPRRVLEMCQNIQDIGRLQTDGRKRSDNLFIAASLRSFGKIFDRQEKYDEALNCHKQALAMFEDYYESSHIDIALTYYYMGQVLRHQGNYEKALDFSQRAMSIYTRYYPNGHAYIASTLNSIGHILYYEGKHDESLKIFEQALTMLKKYYPCGHVEVAFNLAGTANAHYQQGKYDQFLTFNEQALEILRKYYFPGHDEIICILSNIGYVKTEQGKYDEALDFYQQTLAMLEKYYPSYHASIANTFNYISNVLRCQSKYDEALCYCQRALTMQESYYPSGHTSMASSFSNIAVTLIDQGKYNEAIDFQERALSTVEKHNPANHSSIAVNMNNMGFILNKQEKYDEALNFHQRALKIEEKYCSSQKREIAKILGLIGDIFENLNKPILALDYYQQALAIYKTCLHPWHSNVWSLELNIERLSEELGIQL